MTPNPWPPAARPRRNRRHPWLRRLTAEHRLTVDDLIWPVFAQEGTGQRTPILSMPGVERLSVDLLVEAVRDAAALGVPAVAVFPVTAPADKSPDGDEATNPGNLACRAHPRD